MSDNTKIEWADATVNAINGCSVTSPGCTHCYAMKLAGTRLRDHPTRAGLTTQTKAGPVWNGEVRLHEPALLQPLKWKRPRRIFWNAHGDTFHDAVPDESIDRLLAVCALTPQHTHMILTKRSKRMREYMNSQFPRRVARLVVDWLVEGLIKHGKNWPVMTVGDLDCPDDIIIPRRLPNVWLGVSVEDQTRADERIPDLLATPAAIRFISAEPLLGPVDLTRIGFGQYDNEDDIRVWIDALKGGDWSAEIDNNGALCGIARASGGDKLDWVIAGGESGPNARPMHPDWARSLRDQCAAAGVPLHFKQWGEWAPVSHMSEELLEDIYYPAPERSPDASRRCKVDQCVLHKDGKRFDGNAMFELGAFWQGTGAMTMFDVGKKLAGRLLDGVEHDGLPEPRA